MCEPANVDTYKYIYIYFMRERGRIDGGRSLLFIVYQIFIHVYVYMSYTHNISYTHANTRIAAVDSKEQVD